MTGSATAANPMPSSFNVIGSLKHALDLVMHPAALMNSYRDSDLSLNSLMINYVLVLAGIAFVATLIGDVILFGGIFGFLDALLPFISSVIAVFIVGFVLWKLAPTFNSSATQTRATRLAAYAYTPYFLISILNIIPFSPVRDLGYLGLLYGLYIVYLGLPILFGTPKQQVIKYLIVSLVVVFAVYLILEVIIGALLLI